MKQIYPALVILCMVASGCLKRSEKNVNVPCSSGCIVFNIHIGTGENSLQALSGAEVELGWSKPATPIGDAGRLIATGKTSSTGDLQLSFAPQAKELTGGKFYINASRGNDYIPASVSYYTIGKADTIVTTNMHVPSKATLRIVYKSFTPTIASDYFQVCPGFRSFGSEALPVSIKTTTGEPANCLFYNTEPFDRREVVATTAGDQFTYIESLVNKNGIRTTKIDSLLIPKGESRQIEVTY